MSYNISFKFLLVVLPFMIFMTSCSIVKTYERNGLKACLNEDGKKLINKNAIIITDNESFNLITDKNGCLYLPSIYKYRISWLGGPSLQIKRFDQYVEIVLEGYKTHEVYYDYKAFQEKKIIAIDGILDLGHVNLELIQYND